MKPQSKPLFILNPQVLVDGQKIAEVFVNQIKEGIDSQSPLTGDYLKTSATESTVNGIFNMERGNVSLLLGVDPGMTLTNYDKAGIKLPSPTTLIERRILRELRTRFGKELRETKENDTFKVDERKPLATLQLENKNYANMNIAKDIKSYGSLNEIVPIYPKLEGRRQAMGMLRIG